MNQKVVVTGAKGQLGSDLIQCLTKYKIDCIGVSRQDFDLTDTEKMKKYLESIKPTCVIHCAAYTAVDRAEQEPELCYAVNVETTKNIAKVCRTMNTSMVYLSTDYIFSGEGNRLYEITDPAEPVNIYGRTKLEGELVVQEWLKDYFIVRIAWSFGKNGNNFVKTMLRLAKDRQEVKVVDDQIGSPTYTKDLADLLCRMIQTKKYGIYHATNEGFCSWAEFAEEIFRLTKKEIKVCKISSKEYPSIAKRPFNTKLSKKSLDEAGFYRLPHWKDALERYLKEIE